MQIHDRSAACGIMSVIDRSPAVIDISRQSGSLFACIYLEHDFAIKLACVGGYFTDAVCYIICNIATIN